MDNISDAARKMGRLIDDLLEFSRMGRKGMQMRKANLGKLFHEAITELRDETMGREIIWKIGALPDVYGDPAMLRRVLVNLISNAVKFTRKRPQAEIEVECTRDRDEFIFFIRDNGVGFDMEFADKLFGVFQRLHSSDEFEGTGIGLSLVQRIIFRHKGKTWAEGSVGKGATFYFTIPKTKENRS
jgi:light-regulated signal transduction histidine kinase (bacteriophytochrome)